MSSSGRLKIAACVGVELPTHERWLPVPKGPERAACMGVWTVATCMSRMRESDGWCALEWLDAYATPEIIARLVAVGLFAHEDQNGVHGVRVLRYEDWNETKAEIDKRLRDGRRRQKISRSRRNVTRDIGVTDGVTSDVTETVTVGVTLGRGIGEGIGSDQGESERESATVGPEYRTVRTTDKITPELRAAAEMTGLRDVDTTWLQFCGHYAGQHVHVEGRWQYWCGEQRRRDRAAQERNGRFAGRGGPQDAPPAKRPTPESIAEAERAYEAATRKEGQGTVAAVVAAVGGKR